MDLEERSETYQRVCAEVSLDAVCHNAQYLNERVGSDTKMAAVIKADGYGHGSIAISQELESLDFIWGFAVATAEEAFLLRENGVTKPVLVLGSVFPYAYERMAGEDIRFTVFSREMLPALSQAAERAGRPVKVHVKVDTGMARIGVPPDEEGLDFVSALMGYVKDGSLEPEGIFTHFARADERDQSDAVRQLAVFQDFLARLQSERGIEFPMRHCANSAAILALPGSDMELVRAGIALYGLLPSGEMPGGPFELEPALSLRSRIVLVKPLRKGQSVSYGGTFTAQRDMRIATIPVGYGDGYPRSLSGRGSVLIRGRRAAILGRICMDQFMVDVSDIPGVCEGDIVTLIGADGEERITAEELGELSGRFNYELVCDLGRRVPRMFYRGGRAVAAQDMGGFYK